MAMGNAVWGIEVGQCALKAIKLRAVEDRKVELVAFDLIEHPKILSQPDADAEELIRAALEKYTSRNDWQGDAFVIGVPGQQTFARFTKLPPVDPKKIPDLVRFEASQQIPFDMEDVVWDYEVFTDKESPDVEVGIFAMRKDLIRKQLGHYSAFGIAPLAIQTIPSALYNFCRFERPTTGKSGAIVIIDVGAQNTDLVIAEPHSAWTRNIPLGGNSFTEALVKAFKLSFAKAESLKRTAATSKYARQIFQAMRPVFAELVAEVQRSIGFYTSTHRDVELSSVLACGNAFRLPGLQKYLENNLTIPGGVVKLEKFESLVPTATANAPQFTENIMSFGVAYGLALQGLGVAAVSASLLPPELARVALWKKKRPYFVAAAACLGLAAVCPWTRIAIDSSALAANESEGNRARAIIDEARRYRDEFRQAQTDTGSKEENIRKLLALQKDKGVIPHLVALVHEAMPDLEPEVLAADTPDKLRRLVQEGGGRFARTQRKQLFIETLKVSYVKDIDTYDTGAAGAVSGGGPAGFEGFSPLAGIPGGGPRSARGEFTEEYAFDSGGGQGGESGEGGAGGAPGFYVRVTGRMLYGSSSSEAYRLFTEEYFDRLRRLGERDGLGFYLVSDDPKNPGRLLRAPTIRKYFEQAQPGGPSVVSGARTPAVAVVSAAPGVPSAEEAAAAAYRDPVTQEDMRSDWQFEFGFKVKLGEKPAGEEQLAEQEAGGD